MQVNNINKTDLTCFNSGISNTDLRKLKTILPSSTEKYFIDKYGIKANFSENQTISILNLLCRNILDRLKKTKLFDILPINTNPSSIRVFNCNELTKPYPDNFCTTKTKQIIKNESPYKPISLFFVNDKFDLEEIEEMVRKAKRNNFISNDNFLGFTMHEWMHIVHLNYLYKKNNFNEQHFANEIKRIKKIYLNNREKSIIRECLGEYAYNGGNTNQMEVVAEGLNKIICSCLNDNEVGISSNPEDVINSLPKELILILMKIINCNDARYGL